MHSIHAILVNITDAIRNDEKKITEMTKEELKERVINYAENHSLLWDELKCCYYCCKGFLLTAFSNDETMIELLELTRQISGKEERLSL